MEEKSLSFKNVVNGEYRLSTKMPILSLIKYQQKNQERICFLLEQSDGEKIYLYQLQLLPQANSNQAKLEYHSIGFAELKKIPDTATGTPMYQSWNLSVTKLALLEGIIASQMGYDICCQMDGANESYTSIQWDEPTKKRSPLEWSNELLALVQLRTHPWKKLKLDASNQKIIDKKPPVVAATSASQFFPSSSGVDNKATFVKYGETSLQDKAFEAALQKFNEALKLDADYVIAKQGKARALFELGIIAYNQENYAKAQENFQIAKDLVPNNKTYAEALLLATQKVVPQHAEQLALPKQFPNPIENLIFQGGGIKGLAYVGDLEVLLSGDYDFSLEQIKRVGGTSAGAITALGVGLGYSVNEIKSIMIETPFSDFFDGEYKDVFLDLNTRSEEVGKKLKDKLQGNTVSVVSGVASAYSSDKDVDAIKKAFALLKEEGFGLFAGERLRNWFEALIRLKTGGVKKVDGTIEGGLEHVTFNELYQLRQAEPEKYKHFKDLYFVGVNLTLSQVEVFSHEHTPDVVVSDALRISMSIPLIFKAHHVFVKNAATNFERRQDPKQHLYVDGGILSNCPIWLFDDARYIAGSLQKSGHQINPHTLAFMLADPEQHSHLEQNTRLANEIPKDIIGYLKQLVNCIFENSERQIPTINNRQRTIFVDNKGVKTTEFNLTPFKRDHLLLSGKQSVEAYFVRLAQEAAMVVKSQIYPVYFAYLNPTQQDAEGNTLLHTAIKQADWGLVRYLCTERIAEIDKAARNQAGETVMDLVGKQTVSAQQIEALALLTQWDFPKAIVPTLIP